MHEPAPLPNGNSGTEADTAATLARIAEVLASPGRPIDAATRRALEPRLGRDLDHVRLHTDAMAAASAAAVGAPAYSAGHHIVLGHAAYATGMAANRYILAHEIVHVLQGAPNAHAPWRSSATDAPEREARALVQQLIQCSPTEHGSPGPPRARRTALLHCFDEAKVPEVDAEAFAAELATLERLLHGSINDRDRSSILTLLEGWAEPERIDSAWQRLGEAALDRFLRKLHVEDFTSHAPTILACYAALPDGDHVDRLRRLANAPMGVMSIEQASRAYFDVLAIAPEQLGSVTRSESQESRFVERIKVLLPREIRVALIEAATTPSAASLESESPAAQPVEPSRSAAATVAALDELLGAKKPDEAVLAAALGQFARLADLQREGAAGSGDVFRSAVLAAERRGSLAPWLEALFARGEASRPTAVYSETLTAILSARPFGVLQPHLLKLLRADQSAPRVDPDDARLAQAIVDARPAGEQVLLMDGLRADPSGDLSARLPIDARVAAARGQILADEWLNELAAATDRLLGERDDADASAQEPWWAVLDRLLVYRPSGRDLHADVALLDAAGLIDSLLDRVLDSADYNAAEAASVTPLLFTARTVSANIATVRRLAAKRRLTGPQADLIYQMLAVLPADELSMVYRSEPSLEADLKRALPDSVRRRPDFGPALQLGHAADALVQALDDDGRWPSLSSPVSHEVDLVSLLPATTRSLLRAAAQAGAADRAAEVAGRHGWNLEEVQLDVSDGEAIVASHDGMKNRSLGLEQMLNLATRSYATWVELGGVGPWRGKLYDLLDVIVFGAGLKRQVDIQGPTFDINQIDTLAQGMVLRVDGGSIDAWHVGIATDDNRHGELFSIASQSLKLEGLFLGMEGLALAIDRISLCDVNAQGDMVIAEHASRVGQLFSGVGLLYAIQDGLRAVADLVIKAVIRAGQPHSALVTASDMLARSGGRFYTSLTVGSVDASGLAVVGRSGTDAGVFTADRVRVGDKPSPWPAFVVHSDHGAEDWPRLLELREKRKRGPLEVGERLELAQLEEDALELVMSVAASRVSIEGLDLVVTDDGKRSFESELTRIDADRIYLQADIDATDEDTGLEAHDLDRSGTASPLEVLRASGDASAEARLLQFHAIISGLQTVSADKAQTGPAVLLEGLAFQSPLGGLTLEAQGVSAGAMAFSILADRFTPDEPAHRSFPDPRAGDRLIEAESLSIDHLTLTIDCTDTLLARWFGTKPPSEQEAEAQTKMLMRFLHDLSGTATFSLHVAIPDLGRLGHLTGLEGWTDTQVLKAELEKGGRLKWRILGRELPQSALRFVDSIDELYDHYANALQAVADLSQLIEPLRDQSDGDEATAAQRDPEAAARRKSIRLSLPAGAAGLSVEGIRRWLEAESGAYVEVKDTDLAWQPTDYDFGSDGAVTLFWGSSGGVHLKLQTLVGTPGTAGIVALEVAPFMLDAISGHRGEVYFAARDLDVDGTLRTLVRLVDSSPDRLAFDLSHTSLGKLWVLARGSPPTP